MSKRVTGQSETTVNARLSGAPVGGLVPMPHGGALRNGGPNRGGPGRPKDALRATMRDSLEALLPVAVAIACDETAAACDRLRSIEFLARYGLGSADSDRTVEVDARRITGVIMMPPEGASAPAERRSTEM
ncbi:MAG: hypothetical protein HY084_05060 [Gemmatimonadetes bacterium]|nr:hypothetical protein [Gemmatimonadota bacterium]